MADNNTPLTKQYDGLELWLRILIQVFAGGLVCGVYRIIRYTETKNTTTLIVGLIFLLTGIGNFVGWLIDLISLIKDGKFTLYVE